MLKAYYQLSTSSKKGRKKLSKSFVKGFIDLLYSSLTAYTYDATDTSGNAAVCYQIYLGGLYCAAPYGDSYIYVDGGGSSSTSGVINVKGDLFGIIVGSGSMAVTTIDDNIQTKIESGTGSGELEYLGMFFPADVTVSGSNASLNVERLFLNSSGGNVVVNEVGLYCGTIWRTGASVSTIGARYFCLIRDLVSPAVTVANGEYLKVTYTLQVSV